MTESIPTTPDFAQLLANARGGSNDALGRLLAGFRTRLLSVACRELDRDVLQPKFGASDVVQETFLRAQRGFTGFAGADEAALLAWLLQVLRNHLSNLRRRYHTDKRLVTREQSLNGTNPEQSRREFPAALMPSPSQVCVRAEEAEALEAAMAGLPNNYRRILQMRYWDGLEFPAIAIRLERSPDAARKLWARAMLRLQRELDQ